MIGGPRLKRGYIKYVEKVNEAHCAFGTGHLGHLLGASPLSAAHLSHRFLQHFSCVHCEQCTVANHLILTFTHLFLISCIAMHPASHPQFSCIHSMDI